MRDIKFRAWDPTSKKWFPSEMGAWVNLTNKGEVVTGFESDVDEEDRGLIISQFTGLKDKNGLTDIYEDDIIGVDGLVKGNKYENGNILKEKTYIVIPGITSKDWQEAHKEAMARGCKYSQ